MTSWSDQNKLPEVKGRLTVVHPRRNPSPPKCFAGVAGICPGTAPSAHVEATFELLSYLEVIWMRRSVALPLETRDSVVSVARNRPVAKKARPVSGLAIPFSAEF
jgi:hypothetical protein